MKTDEFNPRPHFSLSNEERDSKLWARLVEHFESKLMSLRIQNEGDKSEIETANIRGRIAEIKSILSLNNETEVLEQVFEETPPR